MTWQKPYFAASTGTTGINRIPLQHGFNLRVSGAYFPHPHRRASWWWMRAGNFHFSLHLVPSRQLVDEKQRCARNPSTISARTQAERRRRRQRPRRLLRNTKDRCLLSLSAELLFSSRSLPPSPLPSYRLLFSPTPLSSSTTTMTTTTLRIGCTTMDWSLACKARCRDKDFKCEVDTSPRTGGECVKALTIAKGFLEYSQASFSSCRGHGPRMMNPCQRF